MKLIHLKAYYDYSRAIGFNRSISMVYHQIRRRLFRPASLRGFPDALQIEISNGCNLNCEYCVVNQALKGKKIMSLETFESLTPYLKYVGKVRLSGLAEPLLNNNLIPILNLLKTKSPFCHVSVSTNATLLTAAISNQLIDGGLDRLTFSLDGTETGIVDGIRKGGSLAAIMNNILKLNEIKAQKKSGVPVLLATMVAQSKNIAQLPGTVALAAEMGAARLEVNGLEPYREEMLEYVLWQSPSSTRGLSEILLAASLQAEKSGIDLRLASFLPCKARCAEIGTPIILANGDVVPCSVLAYDRDSFLSIAENGSVVPERSTVHKKCFGNIKNKSFPAIWYDQGYVTFRKDIKANKFPKSCKRCLIKHGVSCVTEPLSGKELLAQLETLNQTTGGRNETLH